MLTNTKFPNGIEVVDLLVTNDLKVEGEIIHSSEEALEVKSITTTDNGIIGGTLAVTGPTTLTGAVGITGALTPAVVVIGEAAKALSVDCTSDVTLTAEQSTATSITISTSGTSKTLILSMSAGQLVTITNSGSNDVTIKRVTGDTGVAITVAKTAIYSITAAEPIKVVETA